MSEEIIIPTGSTLLNLALSGSVKGGWRLGRISNIVGDRSSGKTLLAIEAATLFVKRAPKGKIPRAIYYESEAAFDRDYAARDLGMPVDHIEFKQIRLIEEFYESLKEKMEKWKKDEVGLVILDSLDALSASAEDKVAFGKQDFARKAQRLSEFFKKLVTKFKENNIHIMVISQVRENITTLPFSPKWVRSGGKALDFYCTHIVWLAEVAKLKSAKTDRVYGMEVNAKISKNKIAPPYREAMFPVIFNRGIDDIGSLLKFLVDPKIPIEMRVKKETGGYYLFADEKLRLEEMITHIENTPGAYREIVNQSQKAWDSLEELTLVDRKDKSELFDDLTDE